MCTHRQTPAPAERQQPPHHWRILQEDKISSCSYSQRSARGLTTHVENRTRNLTEADALGIDSLDAASGLAFTGIVKLIHLFMNKAHCQHSCRSVTFSPSGLPPLQRRRGQGAPAALCFAGFRLTMREEVAWSSPSSAMNLQTLHALQP